MATTRYLRKSGLFLKWRSAIGFQEQQRLGGSQWFIAASTRATRGLVSSPYPHSSTSLPHHQQQSSTSESSGQSAETARPFSEIPKTKTTLGLNLEMMRDPSRVADYFTKAAHELGHIFRITGTPGLPPMLCVVDPEDVATVFRVGDKDYPQRFRFEVWERARNELDIPFGMFLA